MSKEKNVKLNQENLEVVKSCHLEGEEWTKLVKQEYNKIAKKVEVKGYRPGKAPKNILDQHINKLDVYNHALVEYLKRDRQKIYDELKKDYPTVVNALNYKIEAVSDDEAKFELFFPIATDYHDIKVDKLSTKVDFKKPTDKDVDKFINNQLQTNALLLPLKKEQKTKEGDTVIMNYKGFVNNEAFEGGEAQNFELKIGSKSFIDNFEDQLIGKKVGDKFEVKVTFPKEYPVEKLAGQKANFDVEIVEAKRPEVVKLTKDNLHEVRAGFPKNIEELKRNVKLILEETRVNEALAKFLQDCISEIEEKEKIKVHPVFVYEKAEEKKQMIVNQLKQQKVKLKEYLELLGKDEKEFFELLVKEEQRALVHQLVSAALIVPFEDKVKLEEDAVEKWLKKQAFISGTGVSLLRKFTEGNEKILEQLKNRIKEQLLELELVKKYDKKGYDTLIKSLSDNEKEFVKLSDLQEKEEKKQQKNILTSNNEANKKEENAEVEESQKAEIKEEEIAKTAKKTTTSKTKKKNSTQENKTKKSTKTKKVEK